MIGFKRFLTGAAVFMAAASAASVAGAADMKMTVTNGAHRVVFELNDSAAAKSLYAMLPMRIKVENYSDNEKIFYPAKKLNSAGTPSAGHVKVGTLCYFEPWGNVVMFYDSFDNTYPQLRELGTAVEGKELIEKLSGTLEITK